MASPAGTGQDFAVGSAVGGFRLARVLRASDRKGQLQGQLKVKYFQDRAEGGFVLGRRVTGIDEASILMQVTLDNVAKGKESIFLLSKNDEKEILRLLNLSAKDEGIGKTESNACAIPKQRKRKLNMEDRVMDDGKKKRFNRNVSSGEKLVSELKEPSFVTETLKNRGGCHSSPSCPMRSLHQVAPTSNARRLDMHVASETRRIITPRNVVAARTSSSCSKQSKHTKTGGNRHAYICPLCGLAIPNGRLFDHCKSKKQQLTHPHRSNLIIMQFTQKALGRLHKTPWTKDEMKRRKREWPCKVCGKETKDVKKHIVKNHEDDRRKAAELAALSIVEHLQKLANQSSPITPCKCQCFAQRERHGAGERSEDNQCQSSGDPGLDYLQKRLSQTHDTKNMNTMLKLFRTLLDQMQVNQSLELFQPATHDRIPDAIRSLLATRYKAATVGKLCDALEAFREAVAASLALQQEIPTAALETLRAQIKHCRKISRKVAKTQRSVLWTEQTKNLPIIREETRKLLSDKRIKDDVTKITGMETPSRPDALRLRRILTSLMVITNGHRSGVIENMRLKEYREMEQWDHEFSVIRVLNHKKVSDGPANVFMGNEMRAAVEFYVRTCRPLFSDDDSPDALVFNSAKGKPPKMSEELDAFAKLYDCSLAENPFWNANGIRHFYATRAHIDLSDGERNATAIQMCQRPQTQTNKYLVATTVDCRKGYSHMQTMMGVATLK